MHIDPKRKGVCATHIRVGVFIRARFNPNLVWNPDNRILVQGFGQDAGSFETQVFILGNMAQVGFVTRVPNLKPRTQVLFCFMILLVQIKIRNPCSLRLSCLSHLSGLSFLCERRTKPLSILRHRR